MDNNELIESDYYFTIMDAAYMVDRVGIDNFLKDVLQYCINPEQEMRIQQLLFRLRADDRLNNGG